MSQNNAYERKKFEAEQNKQAEEYRALGMTEEQIKTMYEFDLEQFNSDRRYREHTQAIIPDNFDDNENDDEKLSIFDKFKDTLTTSIETSGDKLRYWWVDEIEDSELFRKIKSMSAENTEFITLYVFDGYTQEEIAHLNHVQNRIFKRNFAELKIF